MGEQMPMKIRGRLVAIVSALALVGCVSYSKVSQRRPDFHPVPAGVGALADAESAIQQALRQDRNRPLVALGKYIRALKASWQQLTENPHDSVARRDYNFALGRVLATIHDAKLEPWKQPVVVPAEDGEYVLAHKPDPRPLWNPALYEFTPADQFDIKGKYVSRRTTRNGVGAPLVAIGREVRKDARADFALPRVYYGVTALASFEGPRCVLTFEDPLAVETVRLGRHNVPLAADFTVPVAVLLASSDPKKLELTRLLRPEKYIETARIARLQPYDPNKTVVLVIHGLMDSPATWTPMINTLRGDEDIRRNYQFWFFSYPTGYPYPYSAAILRRELDAIQKKFPLRKRMVVIGHSMGGCIGRLLITDTDDRLWLKIFGKPPQEVRLRPEDKQLFTDALMFRHRPEVGRVIFIAAPLRGSGLASHPIGRLGSSLVKMPLTLLRAGRDVLSAVVFETDELKMKRIPNSVDTLAPTNRFVKAVNTIPITSGIPYHTIMGDRGRGDTPNSSDGVVPYWSSHMKGANSELIVPSNHSVHQSPKAIDEVTRILELALHDG
jgi:pimeloyl-ACP methyl ester carboxylesterase